MNVKKMVFVALMAALCCVLGPLSIPIGAVPISLTVVSVYLCVYVLKTGMGTLAYVIYLLLGLVGLPVFSGFVGGPAKLVGPTGGYLIGFILMALISGAFIDRAQKLGGAKRICLQVVGMVIGLAVCYLFGTAWFVFSMDVTWGQALATCVIPFLPFDAIKIVLCVVLGNALRKALSAAKLMAY